MSTAIPTVPLDALIYALKKVLGIEIDPNALDAEIRVAGHVERILEQSETIAQLLDYIEIYEEEHPDNTDELPSNDVYEWSTDLVRPPSGAEDVLFDSPPTRGRLTRLKDELKLK